jgi:ubiquitin-conjugating enzyme E2 J2
MNIAAKRLKKEYTKLQKDPIPLGIAAPLETNILEWRFVIKGIEDYSGGYYQGKLIFPIEYPQLPPSILFITPNGRFETNRRICMSISDYHPETWSPGWTVGTILTGIISFFNCEERTQGSVHYCSKEQKHKYASESMIFNLKDPIFVQLFGTNPENLFSPKCTDLNTKSASLVTTTDDDVTAEFHGDSHSLDDSHTVNLVTSKETNINDRTSLITASSTIVNTDDKKTIATQIPNAINTNNENIAIDATNHELRHNNTEVPAAVNTRSSPMRLLLSCFQKIT